MTRFADFNGVRVPCEAVLETFRPEPWSGKPEVVPYTTYRVKVTGWSIEVGAVEFRPDLPGPTSISDTRINRTSRGQRGTAFEHWPAL